MPLEFVGTIEVALEAEVSAEQLPLIGTAIKDNFDGTQMLLSTKSMRNAVDAGISTAESLIESDANWLIDAQQTLTNDINSALQSVGFAGSVSVTVDGSGNIALDFADNKTLSDSVSLSNNLGLSNLQLSLTGTATASLTYSYNLMLGVELPTAALSSMRVRPSCRLLPPLLKRMSAPMQTFGFLNFKATDCRLRP